MDFPFFKTKTEDLERKFDLNSPAGRKEYFDFKAGPEIEKLKEYFKKNTFIAYLLGKKGSGKGTCTQLLQEIFGADKIEHLSVGDLIRAIDEELADNDSRKELEKFLKENYRGWLSLEEAIKSLEQRSTKALLSTELILALVKREIAKKEKKTLFIDGFPRELDQISYSLFFRDLVGYREDRDIFILIDLPESVIDQRIKWRRVCPLCQNSRNLKLLPTSKVCFDQDSKEFYLVCDNPICPALQSFAEQNLGGQGARMKAKEGADLGLEAFRERLDTDEKLIKQAFSLYGIPRILLRNSFPVEKAGDYANDYEITPEYYFEWDEKEKKVLIKEKPWEVLDDEGKLSYSLLAPPVAVSLIKQLVQVLGI